VIAPKALSPSQLSRPTLLAFANQSLTVSARELLYSSGGIDKFLFSSEKRMAGSTNTNLDVPSSRPGMIDSPARANDRSFNIFRVDICLHVCKKRWKLTHG
jgi:hypothetical protein